MTFHPSGLGASIFSKRYAIHPEESWQQACHRVADHVGHDRFAGQYYSELVNGRFMPGGRIWFGSGRQQGQLLNCFVIPAKDSIEGWAKAISDVMIISARGGGVGVNLSPIRPRGSYINGNGGVATGAVSLMQAINSVGDVIVGGGGRRMALMLALDMTHPDMEEFLNVKLDLKQLNNANISLVMNEDPAEFVRKVRNDETIELRFLQPSGEGLEQATPRATKSIRARDIWGRIVQNAWKSGEPGILNGYLANEQNNIWYHSSLDCTNPCGEIWLEPYGCCCLGALVLPRFVSGGTMDWQQLRTTIHTSVRFLDSVLSINRYPIPEVEENCKLTRRIGLGAMGLHNMLLALGMKYSSPEAIAFLDKLFNFIKIEAYQASIDLARELGPFPAYDEKMLDSGFCQTLPNEIRNGIKNFGIRNCAILTIAPTGTTSLVQDCSSGIEPLYAPVHFRNYWEPTADGSKVNKRELVVDPAFQQYGDLCEGAMEITPRKHFEVQATIQRHIDNAVSKTINLPQDITHEELSDVWLDYLPYCKGTTLYRSGSRGQEPLEYVPSERAAEVMAQQGYLVEGEINDCVSGVCELPVRETSMLT